MPSAPPESTISSLKPLLNKLIDKLDAAEFRGSAQMQTVALNQSSWPALYCANFESDKEHLWNQLLQLVKIGWLQLSPAAASSYNGYALTPRVKILDAKAVRKATGRLVREKTSSERWRDAIEKYLNASEEVKKIAGDCCIAIPGHAMEDVVQRLNSLQTLKNHPLLLREVSSKLFWGMSKVLDNKAGLVAALLDAEECPFPESPLQLQIHLPLYGFSSVLFIENQMSFEQAIRSTSGAFTNLALVYASGFKGSASRMRNRDTVSLYFSGKGETSNGRIGAFEDWLFAPDVTLPVYFWGDLDWSGMRILAAMRKNFTDLKAWEPGYSAMLDALVEGSGHSPEAADKRGQKPLDSTGCGYADTHLLPALRKTNRFIDQEYVNF